MPLRLFLTDAEREEASRLLETGELAPGSSYIVLHATAGSGRHLKQWHAERFARVADRIQDELGLKVVISGMGQDEHPMVADIVAKVKRPVINLFGKTSVRVLSAIIEAARLYVGCDTGPMHLAAAVNTPIVALFGPTDPVQWRPWTLAPSRMIRAGLPCSPCPGKTCPYNVECMSSIEVEEVMQAVRELHDTALKLAHPAVRV